MLGFSKFSVAGENPLIMSSFVKFSIAGEGILIIIGFDRFSEATPDRTLCPSCPSTLTVTPLA